ncbi:MAG: arylsulfatase [Gemmataceae bacterium]
MGWLLILAFAAPPNVILIITDDQGYGDLGCHGNTEIRTPNLDRLHAESVRLTDFHVDPTCSPTRSALMTGRYSSRTGVWHTIAGRSILRRDETTLAQHFARAGYRTGLFGKWHLGDSWPYRAMDRGFAETLVIGGGGIGQTPDAWGNTYFDDVFRRDGRPEKQKGYCTDVIFRAATAFIEKAGAPFFCYIPTNAPHGPYNARPEDVAPYRKAGLPETRAKFYGMISNIDDNVGKLLGRLKALKKDQDTVVIFLTDNGSAAGWPAGMRGMKGSAYDGGHRVPCFWRWPGRLKPRDVPGLTAHLDVLPTLLDLCGLEAKHPLPLDGVSLRPALEGGALPARTLFVHSQRVETPVKWRQSAVMTDRWRLIDGKELYDVRADPGQKADVATKHAEVVKELRAGYERWWQGISTRFGESVPLVIGAKEQNPVELNAHDWHGEQVPWSQPAARKLPAANGWWAVDVARPGTYRFTLRHLPAEAAEELRATRGRVKVSAAEATADVKPGATAVAVTLKLAAGEARMQTWLEGKGAARGAFFVEVRREE